MTRASRLDGQRLSTGIVGIALLALLACATPKPSATGPRKLHPQGTYVHAGTRLEFPERIGIFERVGVTEYDPGGFNASGHYRSPLWLGAIATVYHYPATEDLSWPTREAFLAHFGQVNSELMQATPSAQRLGVSAETVVINGFELHGAHAEYQMPALGAFEGLFRSQIYLFVLEGWYLKFRFSYPDPMADDAIRYERQFIESIHWPVPEAKTN